MEISAPVAASWTEIALLPLLATYNRVPSGLTASDCGRDPTGMVASGAPLLTSRTETVLPTVFATYIRVPETVIAVGPYPTGTVWVEVDI